MDESWLGHSKNWALSLLEYKRKKGGICLGMYSETIDYIRYMQ